jgi:hypothetical protein
MDTAGERVLKRTDVKGMDMTGKHMMMDTTMDSGRVERVH